MGPGSRRAMRGLAGMTAASAAAHQAGLKAQAEHSNTLAATIGELDDRIERLLAISRQPPRH